MVAGGQWVDCDSVVTTDQATGTAYVLVDKMGENQIIVSPGANIAARYVAEASDEILLAQLELPLAVGPEGMIITPAKVAQVVDTTGAGDCFCGFLASTGHLNAVSWKHIGSRVPGCRVITERRY
jgi:sugar/nucleoside kinase (ribokinase family)